MFRIDESHSGKLPAALTKDVSPSVGGVLWPATGAGANSSTTFPRTDPVLVVLSQGNEQEYERMMRTSWAIGGAIQQRTTGLMAHGDQVIQGVSRSPASALLRDFLRAFIDSIPRFYTLRRQVLKSLYYGWMPIELQWSNEDFRFKGRPRAGIADAKARKPWHYHITTGGDLALNSGLGTGYVYDQPDDQGRFMIARALDTESPYGESYLRSFWMLYFTAQQFQRMSNEGMQRSLGLIKATRKNANVSGANGAVVSQGKAEAELLNVLKKLRSNNVLIESQSWSLDVIQNTIAKTVTEVMDYFGTEQRMAIVGQNLTSKVDGGSYAAAQTHGDILDNYLMADAREEMSWWNDGLFRMAIEANFGQVDSDDMPRWQSRIIDRPNMEATQKLYEMGAPVDAKRLSDGQNAALFVGKESDDDIVLRKPEATVRISESAVATPDGVLAAEEGLPSPDGVEPPTATSTAKGSKAPPTSSTPSSNAPVTGGGQKVEVSQAAVLNGAQITAATAIVTSVAAGEIPLDAGLGQLQVLFNLTLEQAKSIMGSAGTNTPTTPNPNPAAAPVAPIAAPAAITGKTRLADVVLRHGPIDGAQVEAEGADRAQAKALSAALDTAGPELERYTDLLLQSYLEAYPDPKA